MCCARIVCIYCLTYLFCCFANVRASFFFNVINSIGGQRSSVEYQFTHWGAVRIAQNKQIACRLTLLGIPIRRDPGSICANCASPSLCSPVPLPLHPPAIVPTCKTVAKLRHHVNNKFGINGPHSDNTYLVAAVEREPKTGLHLRRKWGMLAVITAVRLQAIITSL